MTIQRTLSIIKPDATKRNITGKIIQKFEEGGLSVVAQRRILLTREQAEGFYSVHGSDSEENATIEIAFFFDQGEINS